MAEATSTSCLASIDEDASAGNSNGKQSPGVLVASPNKITKTEYIDVSENHSDAQLSGSQKKAVWTAHHKKKVSMDGGTSSWEVEPIESLRLQKKTTSVTDSLTLSEAFPSRTDDDEFDYSLTLSEPISSRADGEQPSADDSADLDDQQLALHFSADIVGEQTSSVDSGGVTEDEKDPFTRLLAILAALPRGASPPSERPLGCDCGGASDLCQGRQPLQDSAAAAADPGGAPPTPRSSSTSLSHRERVEVALLGAGRQFPDYRDELNRLQVVHASIDVVCFVDHERRRLFTAVCGASKASPRNVADDEQVVPGDTPADAALVQDEYCEVRRRFPNCTESYGCGHSLGGSVLHGIANSVEKQPELAFTRVDVFAAKGSTPPRAASRTALGRTEFRSHDAPGDLLSMLCDPPQAGSDTVHERRLSTPVHPMYPLVPREIQVVQSQLWRMLTCCTGLHR